MLERFSLEEKYIISYGLLALIRDETEAQKLVTDPKIAQSIKEHTEFLEKLNEKVCSLIEEKPDKEATSGYSQSDLADRFTGAMKGLVAKQENLDNFNFYLTMHFKTWVEKFANTPGRLVAEMEYFANTEF